MYPLSEIEKHFPSLSDLNKVYISFLTWEHPNRYYFIKTDNTFHIVDRTFKNAPRDAIILQFFEYVAKKAI